MKLAEYSITIRGDRQAAWDKLLDWQRMPDWDNFIESIHFQNPVRVGSTGSLLVKEGHVFTLRITQFKQLEDYTDEFSTFGTRFIFYHRLKQETAEQLEIYFSIRCEGLLAPIFQFLLDKKFNAQLRATMTKFKEQFESQISADYPG